MLSSVGMRGVNLNQKQKSWHRYGLSLMLLLMFGLILASTLWERSYIRSMKDSCASMYTDRLMVATALFQLSDKVYSKRLVLEGYLEVGKERDASSVYYRLGELDGGIQNVITQIEQTYLVEAESQLLGKLRQELKRYNQLEKKLLTELAAGKSATYDAKLREAFEAVRRELTALTKLQENVGKELSNESFTAAAGASSLTHFQLGAAFILGLLSSGLALSLQSANRKRAASEKTGLDLH